MAKIYKERRHDLHKKYYQKYNNDADRMKNCPRELSMDEWRFLVRLFGSPEFKAMSEQNTKNRVKLDIKTTSGSQSFLSKRRKMTEENGVEPDDVVFFEATHKRKDGTPVDEKSAQLMKEMAELNEQVTQGSIKLMQTGIVHKVIHGPQKGRCLLWGDTVSPTELYGRQGSQEERHQEEMEEQKRLLEAKHAEELAKRDEELAKREEELAKQAKEAAAKAAQIQAMIDRAVAQAMRQAMGMQCPPPTDNQLQDGS